MLLSIQELCKNFKWEIFIKIYVFNILEIEVLDFFEENNFFNLEFLKNVYVVFKSEKISFKWINFCL